MRDLLERMQELSEGPDLPDRGKASLHVRELDQAIQEERKARKAALEALGAYRDSLGNMASYAGWIGKAGGNVPKEAREAAQEMADSVDEMEDWIVDRVMVTIERGTVKKGKGRYESWARTLHKLMNALKRAK